MFLIRMLDFLLSQNCSAFEYLLAVFKEFWLVSSPPPGEETISEETKPVASN